MLHEHREKLKEYTWELNHEIDEFLETQFNTVLDTPFWEIRAHYINIDLNTDEFKRKIKNEILDEMAWLMSENTIAVLSERVRKSLDDIPDKEELLKKYTKAELVDYIYELSDKVFEIVE